MKILILIIVLFTDLENYPEGEDDLDCPPDLVLPEHETVTLPPLEPEAGETGATGPRGFMGSTGATGRTGFPGANGAEGATGPMGVPGVMGATGSDGATGATGAVGPMGAIGARGPKGEKGDQGAVGKQGPPGETITVKVPTAKASSEESEDFFSNPLLVLILMIWLAFLTLLLLIFFILLIRWKRDTLSRSTLTPYSSSVSNDFKPTNWMESLREDSETGYSVETISDNSMQNQSKDASAIEQDLNASDTTTVSSMGSVGSGHPLYT